MKKIIFSMLSLTIISSSVFAEIPHAKRLLKTEGKGQFVTAADGQQFCTHAQTILAFAESNSTLGMEVLNKNTGEIAGYFLNNSNYLEKFQGSSEFPKYILINTSTYYFNSISELASAEVDAGFMFKRIYDTKKSTSTLYCSKK